MECSLLYEAPDHVLLDLNGAMDAKGTGAIEESLKRQACAGTKHLLLDLADVTFLSSIGLRLLLQTAKTLASKNLHLLLVGPQDLVADVISGAAMDKLVPVVPDVAAAKAYLDSVA